MAFCFHRACTLPTLVLIIAKALNDVFEVLEVGIEEILAENSGFRLPFATDTYSSVPSVVPPVIFMVWLVLKYMLLSNHQLIMRLTLLARDHSTSELLLQQTQLKVSCRHLTLDVAEEG
ncbi:uncharacterized protein [Lolium perenne]|uniref:uncharacterized protein n=1 Tax=Lolium perenne TaxID=4522 RepID=UPI003A9A42AA